MKKYEICFYNNLAQCDEKRFLVVEQETVDYPEGIKEKHIDENERVDATYQKLVVYELGLRGGRKKLDSWSLGYSVETLEEDEEIAWVTQSFKNTYDEYFRQGAYVYIGTSPVKPKEADLELQVELEHNR